MIDNKIKTLGELNKVVVDLKKQNKKIVTTNGVFDILHAGHVRYLENAKKLGDILIVGINSDNSVKVNKGPNRPINKEKSRCEVVASLESVNYVFVFDENTPVEFISIIKPDFHVKAGDYRKSSMPEAEVVEKNGGKVKIIGFRRGSSTTKTIRRIVSLYSSSTHDKPNKFKY